MLQEAGRTYFQNLDLTGSCFGIKSKKKVSLLHFTKHSYPDN